MTKEELLARISAVEIRNGKARYGRDLREAILEYALGRVAGGDSLNQIATELGVNGWTLQRWRQDADKKTRVLSGAVEPAVGMSFVRLETASSPRPAPVEVLVRGLVVRAPVGFDGETLSRVVAIVGRGAA